MPANVQNISNLRARLLQHIVSTHFLSTFGANWWEEKLLFHMRDEGQKGSFSGDKYAVALRKYGRQITFENLDTTVLSTVVLYDQFFQQPPNKVIYTTYERDIIKQMHQLRNRVGHEETDMQTYDEATKKLLSLLRESIDKLNLLEANPKLAQDILQEYFNANGDQGSADKTMQRFIDTSARFEKAEKLYKWNIDEALPIYIGLADEGYPAALQKLLYTYTHTTRYFDLSKACDVAEKLMAAGNLSAEELHMYQKARDSLSMALLGDPDACAYMMEMLTINAGNESGSYLQSAQALTYIQKITKAFPQGLLSVGMDSYHKEIHELNFSDLETKRKANDAEAYAETAYRMLFQKSLDLTKAKRCAEKAHKLGSKRGEYLAEIIDLAIKQNMRYAVTMKVVAKVGQDGYLPIIEYFAEQGRVASSKSEREAARQWTQIGAQLGSEKCQRWLQELEALSAEDEKNVPVYLEVQPDNRVSATDEEARAKIRVLEHKIKVQNWIMRGMGAIIVLLSILAIAK